MKRMVLSLCGAVLAASLLIACSPQPAFADASTTIDVGGALTQINQLVVTVLLGLVPVFLKMAFTQWQAKTGITVDAAHRQVLLDGIDNAIAFAQHALDGNLAGKTSLDVRDAYIARAFTYLAPKVPDAMDHLGVTADGLQQLIAARVTKLVGVDQPAATPAVAAAMVAADPPTGAVPKAAAMAATLMLFVALGLGLGACATSDGADPLLQFAGQVRAYDADAQSKALALSSGAITDVKTVGQSACGYASMADGLFKMAAPLMAASGVDPSVIASETGVMKDVKLGCSVLDGADPSTPVATIATAAATVIAALPQVKAALQAGAPDLASAAAAPVPAAPAPAG